MHCVLRRALCLHARLETVWWRQLSTMRSHCPVLTCLRRSLQRRWEGEKHGLYVTPTPISHTHSHTLTTPLRSIPSLPRAADTRRPTPHRTNACAGRKNGLSDITDEDVFSAVTKTHARLEGSYAFVALITGWGTFQRSPTNPATNPPTLLQAGVCSNAPQPTPTNSPTLLQAGVRSNAPQPTPQPPPRPISQPTNPVGSARVEGLCTW